MTERQSRISRSFDDTPIHYDVYDAETDRTVVVVPGFWRDRSHPSMQRLAEYLRSHGYRVVMIDVRGHGDSGGRYGFDRFEYRDVEAVLRDIFEERPSSRVALVGLSMGGAIAISAAAECGMRIESLLLISSVAEFGSIRPRLNPLHFRRHLAVAQALKRPRFEWRFVLTEKRNALDDIRKVHVPLCLIHVEDDWLIGHRHSLRLYEAAAEPKELHILDVPGNYHADRIFSVAAERVEPLVEGFLRKTLGHP